MWESCLYSPEEEIEFLGYLGKELSPKGIKIFCYDHCRERVFERAKNVFNSPNGKFCAGIANHWYSGDHFGELKAFNKVFPNKISIASEGCCVVSENSALKNAERYAHDILNCFENGLHYYCDWNLTLNENHGPFHNREGRGCFADAPVHCIESTDTIIYSLSYYYIGHFSKFVLPGAKVISSSSYDYNLESLAFKNPDGSIVLVLLNRTDLNKKCIIRIEDYIYEFELEAHTISTSIITR